MAKLFRGSLVQTVILAIAAILFISSATGAGFRLFSIENSGYSTAFQNPHARFAGVHYGGQAFTQGDFSTTFAFEADNFPNVAGEMTSVFIPSESLGGITSWIPIDWLQQNSVISNPQKSYDWNISGKMYHMEQWVLKWYISISSDDVQNNPINSWDVGKIIRSSYTNAEVWFEFDLTPTWYIQGGGTAYFAIAKIQVSNVKMSGVDNNGQSQAANTEMSVAPESVGSILYMYNGLFGASNPPVTPDIFQGKTLNPAYFRNQIFSKITLNNFGTNYWNEAFTLKGKGDVITLGFDVSVFVIGEWSVQDIQKNPNNYGRTQQTSLPPSIMDYLANPQNQAWIMTAVAFGIFILVLLVAPGFLIAIVAIFAGGRKRR